MKVVGGCATVLLVVALVFGIVAGTWGLSVATAGIVGRGEAHKRIQSADFRLEAYNHFFNLCAAVQTAEGSLDAQFDLLASGARDPDITNTNIAALKANRAQSISEYNAAARKDYTEGQFRDNSLPYQLSTASYDQKGPHTSCN